MGLGIYETTDPDNKFSQDGILTNALCLAFDGILGGTIQKRLYVRNDDSLYYYTDIEVDPVRYTGSDISDGVNGFSWKLIAGDTEPVEDQWSLVTPGASIDLGDLGSAGSPDISTYLPFWLRVTVPPNTLVQTFEGTRLDITAEKNIV